MIDTKTKVVKYILLFILSLVLLTPLLVSSKFLFPFITTKTMFFRILVELAVVVYVFLCFLNKSFRPKMNKLAWAVVVFGGVVFLTSLTGVNFYKSFWGTIERGEGFLTISHLIIYFLLLLWTIKDRKSWLNYFSILVGVGVLVDLYALLQQAGVQEFFLFGRVIDANGRLTASLGNAAFLGAFTLAQFFLSLMLFLKRKNWLLKIVFLASAVLNFYVMFNTQTRGALLAWLTVMVVGGVFYVLKSPAKTKKLVLAGGLLVVTVFSLIVWFSRTTDWVQQNDTLRRLTSISSTDVTTESRLLAADTSWHGWKDRFILGYGWENYNVAFNKYFHAEIFKDQGSQLWFDRAHNTPFDLAVASGLIGLVAYLSIFVLAWVILWKYRHHDFDLAVVMLALITAHFLQNVFVFDVLSTYIILFSVLAFIAWLKLAGQEETDETTATSFNVVPGLIAVLLLLPAIYFFNIKPLQANLKAVDALLAARTGKQATAFDYFKQAIDMNTYQTPELRQKMADNTLTYNQTANGLDGQQVKEIFELTIDELQKNIEAADDDVQHYLYLMAILNRAAYLDSSYQKRVLELGKKALELSPTRPQVYFEMGQAAINMKDFEAGVDYFKKAVELNENNLESKWNLMAAYLIAGVDDKAKEIVEQMKEMGVDFNSQDNLSRLYKVYLVAGNKQGVAEVLEKLTILQPDEAMNFARLAAIYKELGMNESARTAVLRAVELDPSLSAEAEVFLQSLE